MLLGGPSSNLTLSLVTAMQPVTQLDILSRTLTLLYLMQILGALHLFPLFFTLPSPTHPVQKRPLLTRPITPWIICCILELLNTLPHLSRKSCALAQSRLFPRLAKAECSWPTCRGAGNPAGLRLQYRRARPVTVLCLCQQQKRSIELWLIARRIQMTMDTEFHGMK